MVLLIAASDHGRRLGGVLGSLDCCLMLCFFTLLVCDKLSSFAFAGITSFGKELVVSR